MWVGVRAEPVALLRMPSIGIAAVARLVDAQPFHGILS